MESTEIRPDVQVAISELVLHELARYGAERVEAVDAEDHQGDPAILVLVHYRSPDAMPDPMVAAALITKLNDRLFELKERRFGYIAHRVPDAA